jgi:glycosyltransferase involved in cell wall biosynthesis
MPGEAEPPRIAILVACHDDGATLRETIDSVRGEPHSELVVVDDGSTDPRTHDLLAELEHEGIAVLRQENAGPSAAWMAGFAATTAGFVMPFSSDDVLVPGATATLADALDADPAAAVAWGDMTTFGLATAYRPSLPVLDPWHITYTNCIPPYSLFRRVAITESGGWAAFSADEDWDLWMRMAALGQRGLHVPGAVYRYRRDAGGRFLAHAKNYEPVFADLRARNSALFASRPVNRRSSPSPAVLKLLLPVLDVLPVVPRLKKVQISEALTLLFWSGGLRPTIRIVLEGLRFRARLRRGGA